MYSSSESFLIQYGRTFVFALIFLLGTQCTRNHAKEVSLAKLDSSEFIKGLSFVGPPRKVNQDAFNPVVRVNAEWLSLMPYAFCPPDEAQIIYDTHWQWWGERTEGVIACSQMAKNAGLKVMLKPHLWIGHGIFTGNYDPGNEKKWRVFEKAYSNYLLHYARIADSLNIEMLCIGTEMELFVKKRTAFWDELIEQVTQIYSGKLTYAANWDEYKRVPFWDKMDYIGIDAYFPLSEGSNRKKSQVDSAWTHWKNEMRLFSNLHAKPILFTEIGYRSCTNNLQEPWQSSRDQDLDLSAQNFAYDCLFNAIEEENWIAGMFIWKWYATHDGAGGSNDDRFTPQNKPAEKALTQFYAR